jgi:hypothetical protein
MALLVFAGSFALGLGGTYLLIAKSGDQGVHAVPRPKASSEQPAAPDKHHGSTSGSAADPAAVRPTDGQEPHAAVGRPEEPAELNVPIDATADEPAEPTWWSGLEGHRCRVRLDEVGFSVLSVRKGTFEGGARVDWDAQFNGARRVGSLRSKDQPVVTVHALGFDAEGMPSAALVELVGAKPVTGVIALQVEGKQIRLEPVTEEAID